MIQADPALADFARGEVKSVHRQIASAVLAMQSVRSWILGGLPGGDSQVDRRAAADADLSTAPVPGVQRPLRSTHRRHRRPPSATRSAQAPAVKGFNPKDAQRPMTHDPEIGDWSGEGRGEH